MSCDIHVHTEVKINGKWVTYGTPEIEGDYRLFHKMAGVRPCDLYEADVPICDPKGFPDDASELAQIHFDYWGTDAHSASWFTAEEIHQLSAWVEENMKWRTERDRIYGFEGLFGHFFGDGWAGWLDYPEERRIAVVEDIRFVFWFDN